MTRSKLPALVCGAGLLAACSSTTAGTAVPEGAGPAQASSGIPTPGRPASGGAREGVARVKLDGAVPPGAERIAMDCRVAAGSVVASPADPLNAPEYAPMVSLRTGGAPTTETVMFSVRVGVLLGDKPFTTAVDGGSYVISGTASGLAGSVDQGGITQVKKSFEVRLTCPA